MSEKICCVCYEPAETRVVTPCKHTDTICETCYQKVTSFNLNRLNGLNIKKYLLIKSHTSIAD